MGDLLPSPVDGVIAPYGHNPSAGDYFVDSASGLGDAFGYNFGAGEAPAVSQDYVALIERLAPTAAKIIEGSDPRETVEVIKTKIKNYEKMRVTPPYSVVPGALWYDNEIAKMRARLRVLKVEAAEVREGVQAKREWRSLGQSAIGVGIVVGFGIIALLSAATIKTLRRNPARLSPEELELQEEIATRSKRLAQMQFQRTLPQRRQYETLGLLVGAGLAGMLVGRATSGFSIPFLSTSPSTPNKKRK